MERESLHIAPGLSAAGSIREALHALQVDAKVIGFPDYMNGGPIKCVDDKRRIEWLITEFFGEDRGPEEFDEERNFDLTEYLLEYVPKFWTEVLQQGGKKTIWFNRRCAADYCFFLEVLRRINPAEKTSIVDLTELRTQNGRRIITTGRACPDLLSSKWNTLRLLVEDDFSRAEKAWSKLRREDAPMRVIKDGDLMSAPIEYFDE